jgi:serine/threonine-protein kinase
MRKEAGHSVGGKYELLRPLGRGSMGEVWVANHRALGQEVAVKLLARDEAHGDYERPTTAAARFRFEARVAARLSAKTRHIVRVTDYGEEEEGAAYLVMELLEGRTLESKLLVRGCLPPAEVTTLVSQIARALEVAHSDGVVHRDLKPANVFITSDEDGWPLVKLLDFGIARTTHTHRPAPSFATADGLIFGTPGYMSPEQARGARADARSDLWALATLAYEALTGELPVPGATTSELMENVHAGRIVPIHERDPELAGALAPFFERAFALNIEDRYPSATAFASAFDRAATQAPDVAVCAPREPFGPRGQTLRIDPAMFAATATQESVAKQESATKQGLATKQESRTKPEWKLPPTRESGTAPAVSKDRLSPSRSFLPLSLLAVFACAGAAETLWRNASPTTAAALAMPIRGAITGLHLAVDRAAERQAAARDRSTTPDPVPPPIGLVTEVQALDASVAPELAAHAAPATAPSVVTESPRPSVPAARAFSPPAAPARPPGAAQRRASPPANPPAAASDKSAVL